MNPSAPKLYGTVKTHKQNLPIRPVVSYIGAPTRKFSMELNNIFKETTKFKSKFSIKNSAELCTKLKNMTIPANCKLVSFDVCSMFSNIPSSECLDLIQTLLDKSKINPTLANEIVSSFKLCTSQNYFTYRNKSYYQNTGLAMGSPLSPLLAEIFMANLETTIEQTEPFKHIIFWYRYVDDVLAGFTGTSRQLTKFLAHINSIHPKIKFTIEEERNNEINFLDITIKRNHPSLSFKIFRKPTATDITIPMDSLHPLQHKLAAYRSMIHRAFNIPLDEKDRETELNIIKTIAAKNKIDTIEINKLINKKRLSTVIDRIYPRVRNDTKEEYAIITYYGNISQKIANPLQNSGIKVAFKTQNKLSNIFYNAKEKPKKLKHSGVYKIKCPDCESFYIGQTGRNIETRLKEHKAAYNTHTKDSTFANHLIESHHTFPAIENTEIIHRCQKSKKLNLLESLEIFKEKQNPNLLNDQTELIFSQLFTCVN